MNSKSNLQLVNLNVVHCHRHLLVNSSFLTLVNACFHVAKHRHVFVHFRIHHELFEAKQNEKENS